MSSGQLCPAVSRMTSSRKPPPPAALLTKGHRCRGPFGDLMTLGNRTEAKTCLACIVWENG